MRSIPIKLQRLTEQILTVDELRETHPITSPFQTDGLSEGTTSGIQMRIIPLRLTIHHRAEIKRQAIIMCRLTRAGMCDFWTINRSPLSI